MPSIPAARNDSEYAAAMEDGFQSAGWKGAEAKALENLQARRRSGQASASSIAALYADLGDTNKPFQWLNTAYQEHEWEAEGLKTDSSFDPIRSDPRFAELVRKMGLRSENQ